VLIESGQRNVPFFVVTAGEIEVIRPSGLGDLLVAVIHAHRFTGDISILTDSQGPSSVHRIYLKRRVPVCLRWVTFGAATSSAWRRQSAKDRSQSRLSIACWPSSP
jgi:hypothetical protein